MKRLMVIVLSAIAAFPSIAVELGQSAPTFDLMRNGSHVKLADFKGKTVYLDFWASWCGPCKQSFPWMNEMQARYGSKGLQILAVNVDQNADDATAFLKISPARFAVAFDPEGKTPQAYAIKGMPTSVLIDPDGRVVALHSGFRSDQKDELERRIKLSLNLKD